MEAHKRGWNLDMEGVGDSCDEVSFLEKVKPKLNIKHIPGEVLA